MSPADDRGAVFIDVVTGMALALLVIGLAQTWARAVLYNQKTLEAVAVARQDATLALDAVARDIRNAGFGLSNGAAPLIAAGKDHVELAADHNADGDTADAHEHIRYAYRADRRQMTRASGRGNAQPFVDDVAPAGVRFSYWDASATEIRSGPSGVNGADLARIRRIDVRLVLELRNPDPQATVAVRTEATVSVAMRNR